MSKNKIEKLDTSTFPCLKYLLVQAKEQEDLYLFSRILFESCDKLSVEPLRAQLLFKSYKINAPRELSFGEYKGEACTPEEYRSFILQDDSLIGKSKCRERLLEFCPSAIMPEEKKKKNDPDICCLCPISRLYKNENLPQELKLIKYMFSGYEAFGKVASWAVIPHSSLLMFRGCWDLVSELDTKTPVVVPLLPLCVQKLIKSGEGILNVSLNSDEKRSSAELVFEAVVSPVCKEIENKYSYASDILNGLGDGLFDRTVKNAIMQLSREVSAAESLSDEDADKIMETIAKNRGKKAKSSAKNDTSDNMTVFQVIDELSLKEVGSDSSADSPEEKAEERPIDNKEVSGADNEDQPSVLMVVNESRVLLREKQTEYGIDLPADSGLYVPDVEQLSPVRELTEDVADDFCRLIECSGICVLEVVFYGKREPSYLIYAKEGDFWTISVSNIPDSIQGILSSPSILKLCWQPYLLYSVSRSYAVAIRNVYSIYSAASMMGYDVSDRMAELERCRLVYESQKQRIVKLLPEKDGFDMYIRAWSVQKNDALMSEKVERATELWDEILGNSYVLGFSIETAGNPMSIGSDGSIVYKASPAGSIIPEKTLLLVISIKGVAVSESLTLLMKSLLYLAGKKYFFKLPLSLFGMDDKSGVVEVLCDESHADLVEDEIQGFLHRYMGRHDMSASVMVHREYSLKTNYKPVQLKTMGLKTALVSLITADSQIETESSRLSSYAKKPTGEENKGGIFK